MNMGKSGDRPAFIKLGPGEQVEPMSPGYVFGVTNPHPVVGIGSVSSYRIRLRHDDFGYIFVSRKHLGLFGKYPLIEKHGVWFPDYDMPQAENIRPVDRKGWI